MPITTLFTPQLKDFKRAIKLLIQHKMWWNFLQPTLRKKKQVSTPNKNDAVVAKEQLCWPREVTKEMSGKVLWSLLDVPVMVRMGGFSLYTEWGLRKLLHTVGRARQPGGGEHLLGNEKWGLDILNFLFCLTMQLSAFHSPWCTGFFPSSSRTLQQASWVTVTHLHRVV